MVAAGFNFPKVFHTRLFGGGNRPGARQQGVAGWLGRLSNYIVDVISKF